MGNIVKPFKQQPSSFAYQPLTVPLISEVGAQNENLRVFSFKEWMKATKKYRQDRVELCDNPYIRFRTFYKGYIDNTTFAPSRTKTGTPVSVVEYLHKSSQALQEWVEEVKSLERFSHPNLVKILGYCCEDNKSLLVLEDLHQGSLDHHIFGKEEGLPWAIRVKIAIGTAQGLAFFHSIMNTPLHLELRLHNIMLNEQYNAKLFYLESNKRNCLEEGTFVALLIYMPPECAMSARLGIEADVYTFGVILLEILAGSKARSRNMENQSSYDWTGSFLPDNYKIEEIIDPRLGSDYPVDAATKMFTLIQSCTKRDKKNRPLMQQVLDVLNNIAEIKY
ncbi:Serine-threonine/tyrosine-protein kinase catalytic domain [Arabidopsis suecica]|uniref:Serine-threonine/tyrosine-protein kinase catalytic domain n=1 Tax=Arabidopsis suecica TaxID=45249 RepID=A0A8T1Z7F6_ARASU|nr:Serine-threonine/tyrosine-protein kinase catalytic domain [Arabidopsis suecica]